jgi:hypothetical protein
MQDLLRAALWGDGDILSGSDNESNLDFEPEQEEPDNDFISGISQDPFIIDSPSGGWHVLPHPPTPRPASSDKHANDGDVAGNAPLKRRHPDSCESGSNSQLARKVAKISGTDGRLKAVHYDPKIQEVIFSAIRHYRFLLSSQHPYPEPMTEITWAKLTWQEGCHLHKVEVVHTPEVLGLVSLSASSLCCFL